MKIICILPCICPSNSNGVSSLLAIYQSLQTVAPNSSIIFISKPYSEVAARDFNALFGHSLRVYNSNTQDSLLKSVSQDKFVLVRPDDIEGVQNDIHWDLANSQNCISIINILLAPPFVFSKNVPKLNYYGEKDYFLLANQPIMPAFAGLEDFNVFLESPLDPILLQDGSFRRFGDRSRPLISVYIGKGIVRPLSDSLYKKLGINSHTLRPDTFAYIKRSWPASKHNLYSLLASSRLLISFDPFSHIERVATMLGTPVLKLCQYNLVELPGVHACSHNSNVDPLPFNTPEKIHSDSKSHYLNALRQNKNNLSHIVSTVLRSAGISTSNIPNPPKTIPFSKQCLSAFSSQLRVLIPYMGAISKAHITEYLTCSDVHDLISPSSDRINMSSKANSYLHQRSFVPEPYLPSRNKRVPYPYLPELRLQ